MSPVSFPALVFDVFARRKVLSDMKQDWTLWAFNFQALENANKLGG